MTNRDCALDDNCVLCPRCFHASNHENHNVSFYLALQPGGCCDCGDREAWKLDAGCKFHPHTPSLRPPDPPIPSDLREMMTRALDCVLDFILDTLDYSPEETAAPTEEADILEAPGDASENGLYAIVIWNDEKHSFPELTTHLSNVTGCPPEEAAGLADTNDYEVHTAKHPGLSHTNIFLCVTGTGSCRDFSSIRARTLRCEPTVSY